MRSDIALSSQVLGTSEDGDFITSLCNLFQCCTTLLWEELFPVTQPEPPKGRRFPTALHSVTTTIEKILSLPSLKLFLQ